jgi:uncharacterized membrane protein YgcG
LDEEAKFEFRKDIYARFFTAAPAGQDFFKQSNTYLHFIADRVMQMTLEIFQDPIKMVDDISALGLRHVGYAIPTELFGPFVSACVQVLQSRTTDETTVEAFRWSLGLTAKMLVRTINEGSTIVMKAINSNTQTSMKKAIACAPRGERATWMLTVQVGTQRISPLAWSVESGAFAAATAIIKDLFTFRADRDRYYYGVDDLFKRHPDIIRMLCDLAPELIPSLLDGLIWRSRNTENGMRRVNYYVKHLLMDEDGRFSKTLQWIAATRDPKLVCHPVIVLVADIVWSKVAYRSFLYGKSWTIFMLLILVTSQSIVEHLDVGVNNEPARIVVFVCRAVVYMLGLTQLLFGHIKNFTKAYRTKNTAKLLCLRIPRYILQWQNGASLFLTLSLSGMLLMEPIVWCWGKTVDMMFDEKCIEMEGQRFGYTVFSMFSVLLYYVLLIDLSVVSTRISAFVLVCVRMLSEIALFLGAIVSTSLAFSSGISVLKQDSKDFAGIQKGAYALFRMVVGVYATNRYHYLEEEPLLLIVVFVFCILTVFFLLSMLVAQLSCAYSSVYVNMVGYARLERAQTIVDIMPSVAKSRWDFFLESLLLHKRLEFNQGDIGVAGGIQMKEAANLNPTTVDMIRRFGGSTSPEIQWPEDEADGDGEDKFEKMEKLLQRTLARITKGGHGKKGGGSATGGSASGTGTKQSGSGGGSEDAASDGSVM